MSRIRVVVTLPPEVHARAKQLAAAWWARLPERERARLMGAMVLGPKRALSAWVEAQIEAAWEEARA